MRIQAILSAVVFHYEATRVVGHTQVMLEGVANTELDPLIVVANKMMAEHLAKQLHSRNLQPFATLYNLDKALAGSRAPLVFDNAALHSLLKEALNEIERLENALAARG